MKISYVTTGNDGIASYRYRIACPAVKLRDLHCQTHVEDKAKADADIVVFSKHWTYADWSYAKFCSLRGQNIVFDVCDDHYSDRLEEHYRRMTDVADLVTCNSEEMAKIIWEKTGREAEVIPDPVLSLRKPYKKADPKMVWYGQTMNIKGLYEVYSYDIDTPLEIVVPGRIDPPRYFNKPSVTWSQWNPWCISEAVDRGATIALLPYRQDKKAKSANRVLEALWSGMTVITDPLPAVMDFWQYTNTGAIQFLDGDHAKLLKDCVHYFEETDLTDDMDNVQRLIEELFSPEAVAKKWEKALCKIA